MKPISKVSALFLVLLLLLLFFLCALGIRATFVFSLCGPKSLFFYPQTTIIRTSFIIYKGASPDPVPGLASIHVPTIGKWVCHESFRVGSKLAEILISRSQ